MRRANSLEKTLMLGKIEGRRKGTTEDEMVRWHHGLNGLELEQKGSSEANLECCCPWGGKALDMTEQLENKNIDILAYHHYGRGPSDNLPCVGGVLFGSSCILNRIHTCKDVPVVHILQDRENGTKYQAHSDQKQLF